MSLKKLIFYGLALIILYHFSRYLTLLIIVVLIIKFLANKIGENKGNVKKYLGKVEDFARRFLVKRKIKGIFKRDKQALGLIKIKKSTALYQCENGDFFLILDGFKATLFSIIRVEFKTDGELASLDILKNIYDLLVSTDSKFRLLLESIDDHLTLYIVLYTIRYTLALTSDLLSSMVDEVGDMRKAIALILSTPNFKNSILNLDIMRNRELIEVIIS